MKTKVLVVDDSAFMRKVISDIVNATDSLEVVGTAKNGKDALDKLMVLKPDVITLDVEMPIMDGLTALREIMNKKPTPVIMLSSLTQEGAEATFKALEFGAVDFIAKPSSIFKVGTDEMKHELEEKIKVALKVKLIKQPIKTVERRPMRQSRPSTGSKRLKKVVAIGTSTGGPRALQSVIPNLPGDLEAAVLIVQHMPPGFTKSLAERMDKLSELNVKEAEDGDVLQAGWAYIAPGDQHLRVKKNGGDLVIALGRDGLVTGHRPSVDAMMESIADLGLNNVIGVIMTGMGADGAKGLVSVKNNRNVVIAQDEDSCVVFGMPKATINEGVVDKVVPLHHLSNEIINNMGVR